MIRRLLLVIALLATFPAFAVQPDEVLPDPALAFSILALTWLSLQNVGWKRPVESRFAAGLLLPGHFFRPHRCRWRMKAAGAGCLPAKPTFFW